MPELDHLVFAIPDLDQGVELVERLTGATAVAGGPHPDMGTHNALLTFDEVTYFEIIAIDPEQGEPAGPRPFGLTPGSSARLVSYAVHPAAGESLEAVCEAVARGGVDPGPIRSMSRVKPDGERLAWRLSFGRSLGGNADGALPFAIDWGETPSPALSLPSMGRLVEFRVAHPDPTVRAGVEGLGIGLAVIDGPPALTAVIDTQCGIVELS